MLYNQDLSKNAIFAQTYNVPKYMTYVKKKEKENCEDYGGSINRD